MSTPAPSFLEAALRPPPVPANFAELPHDVLGRILSFLGPASLVTLGATQKALSTNAAMTAAWRELFIRAFDVLPGDVGMLAANPRECFKRRLLYRQRKAQTAAGKRLADEANQRMADKQYHLGAFLTSFNVVTWALSPFPLLIATTVLLGQKLDGDLPDSVNYGAVFALALVWLSMALVSTLLSCGLWVRERRSLHQGAGARASVLDTQAARLAWTPPSACIDKQLAKAQGPSRIVGLHLAVMIVLLLLVPILLIVKFAAVDEQSSSEAWTSWAVVLIPAWLFLAVLPCTLCSRYPMTANSAGFVGFLTMLCLFALPLLITLILVAVSLDSGYSIPVHLVLVPVWILFALVACMAGGGCIFGAVRAAIIRDFEEMMAIFFAVLAGLVLTLPPLLSLLLLTLKLEGQSDLSFMSVVGPLIFWFCIGTIGSCVGGTALCVDKVCTPWMERRQQAKRDPFDAVL
jgi:hypothetical protein